MALPIGASQQVEESTVTFAVPNRHWGNGYVRPDLMVDYYVLQRDGEAACRLYKLTRPPAQHPPGSQLQPIAPERFHIYMGRLVHPGGGTSE